MKEKWWQQRAAETQLHADNGNTRGLFQSLKYIYGPKKNATVPVFSLDDKTLLTSTEDKKERWTEQFTQLLSETSTVSDTVIYSLPQRPEKPVSMISQIFMRLKKQSARSRTTKVQGQMVYHQNCSPMVVTLLLNISTGYSWRSGSMK